MPALLRRERFTVGRHYGPPHAQVALPEPVAPGLLELPVGEIGRRYELGRHEPITFSPRPVTGCAVDDEELGALLDRGRRGGNGVPSKGRRLALLLGDP